MKRDDIILSLKRFKEMNQNKYSIVRLGLFGSAVRDNLREQSDIDVVVELAKPDLFYLVGIKQDLEEKLNRPVDIVRYREKMNAFLKRRIEREAIYA